MAHGKPWYQRNGGDFVMGTLHMPMEARLAYSLIIDMLNDRDRPLPDDPAFICGFTKLSRRKWTAAREFLLNDLDATGQSRLYLDARGDITNPRFERERARRRGDHATSVENGRIGGQISAEKRAAEQGNFDLSPKKVPDKREINGSKIENELEINRTRPNDNSDLAQAPPQASRARVRGQEIREEEESSPTTDSSTARSAAVVVAVDQSRLEEITRQLCDLGGVSKPIRDTNLDTVRQWLADGVDIERTAMPAIEQQFAATDETSIGGLPFYAARVARDHAKAARASRKPKRAPPRPVMAPDGEAVRFAAVRVDLLAALGPYAYSLFCNDVRFAVADGDDHEMTIAGKGAMHSRLFDDGRQSLFRSVGEQHGFTHVRTVRLP